MTNQATVQKTKLTKAQQVEFEGLRDNKSAQIRFLTSLGWEKRRDIADYVGVIYQFVRNVQENEIARQARSK